MQYIVGPTFREGEGALGTKRPWWKSNTCTRSDTAPDACELLNRERVDIICEFAEEVVK